MAARGAMVLGLLLLGCAPVPEGPVVPRGPAKVAFLDEDFLAVTLEVTGSGDPVALRRLTDCAAAEAMARRGRPFARHLRTAVTEEAGISRADAIYTVSPTRPAGLFVIDAEAVAAQCREQGTVRV